MLLFSEPQTRHLGYGRRTRDDGLSVQATGYAMEVG